MMGRLKRVLSGFALDSDMGMGFAARHAKIVVKPEHCVYRQNPLHPLWNLHGGVPNTCHNHCP